MTILIFRQDVGRLAAYTNGVRHMGTNMLIECLTLSAAVDVLSILLDADMCPGGAFRMTHPWPRRTPFHFTFSAAPPAHLVKQLLAIPDTFIVEKGAI